jgi:hypothetical protein
VVRLLTPLVPIDILIYNSIKGLAIERSTDQLILKSDENSQDMRSGQLKLSI